MKKGDDQRLARAYRAAVGFPYSFLGVLASIFIYVAFAEMRTIYGQKAFEFVGLVGGLALFVYATFLFIRSFCDLGYARDWLPWSGPIIAIVCLPLGPLTIVMMGLSLLLWIVALMVGASMARSEIHKHGVQKISPFMVNLRVRELAAQNPENA